MNVTVKAKIETIRIVEDGATFQVQVSFPEFRGPGGDPVACCFETSLQEYQDWAAPAGVVKSPEAYVEHKYVRPAHAKLTAIHAAIGKLGGKEYDW